MFGKNNKKSQKDLPSTMALGQITTRSLTAKSSTMKLLIGNAQHQGARNYQEDSFGISDISPEAIEKKTVYLQFSQMGWEVWQTGKKSASRL